MNRILKIRKSCNTCSSQFFIKQTHIHGQLYKNQKGVFLSGVISSDIVDSDNQRFDPSVLKQWSEVLKTGDIPLGLNHSYKVEDQVGFFVHSELQKSDLTYLIGIAKLNETHKSIGDIIELIKRGGNVGLSVEASDPEIVKKADYELIKSAKLKGVSLVSHPACEVCRSISVFEKRMKPKLISGSLVNLAAKSLWRPRL